MLGLAPPTNLTNLVAQFPNPNLLNALNGNLPFQIPHNSPLLINDVNFVAGSSLECDNCIGFFLEYNAFGINEMGVNVHTFTWLTPILKCIGIGSVRCQ